MSEILQLPADMKFCVFREPADMRNQFDGLNGLVEKRLKLHISEERTMFFFFNKRRTHMKALLYEPTKMTLLYSRLHNGTFDLPYYTEDQKSIALTPVMITSLLQGLCLHTLRA